MQHGGQQKQLEAWYCENEKKTTEPFCALRMLNFAQKAFLGDLEWRGFDLRCTEGVNFSCFYPKSSS